MSRVQRLPDELVDKIAAGEVVERPASVVKELVENAIDAGAAAVQVEIEGGGRALVRVRDDGSGMIGADAELALERHATSKLRSVEDLLAVSTHGFRGEALPSIASVSELLLRTRTEGETAGTEVRVRHGRERETRETGHPRGTTVEVRDLFGAVPARRKFLRAESTEAAHVAEAITLLALARPGVSFFLRSSGRSVIEAPAAQSLGPRIYQLFGARFLEGLVEVDGGEEWAQVSGFVSRPDGRRPARPSLRLFVNHRSVRDRALAKAVAEAYRKAGVGSGGFEAILFIDVPPAMVDVNVHPAKTEVRFAEGRTVFTAVEKSVRAALAAGGRQAPRADTRRVEAAVQTFLATQAREPAHGQASSFTPRPAASSAIGGTSGDAHGAGRVSEPEVAFEADAVPEAGELRVLGQHRNTYIVASDGEEIVLVDQHTAHERVRFERVVAGLDAHAAGAQLLLSPVVVKLPPALLPLLEAHAETLLALGYEVEGFGGGSTRLRSVPALLAGRDPAAGLEALLRDFQERDGGDWTVSGSRDRLAATVACHSAVRAGQALAHEAMAAIVRGLRTTRHPTLCPHGRPTLVRIPREDVSRWFGRVGWRRQ